MFDNELKRKEEEEEAERKRQTERQEVCNAFGLRARLRT